jgi:hypothetical protein
LIVNIQLTYTYTFPLHFVAKVKVKKEKEEICCVQCCHVKNLSFCLKYDANVMNFLEMQAFCGIFFDKGLG